ncbi:MAG TPA: HepT-like ribonuclease domain-containing protein [Thermoleophilaceae bacterium]
MSREERRRLEDIRDAIGAIERYMARAGAEGATLEDPMLHDALLFQFVVIGEAVKSLSAETRSGEPEVPWESVAGLRDLIAHQYFRIEMARIVEIVERDVPRLSGAIDRLLT